MKIFHTSPEKIKKITHNGLFNDCLFFSSSVYKMTESSEYFVYSIEIEDDKIIHVSDLYDEEIIGEIADYFETNEEQAERLLDGRDTVFDYGHDGEDDWWVQAQQGACAKKMGYDACEAIDEQGTVYIVPMIGRESDLKIEEIK